MIHRTPLHEWHLAHGARMTEFAGWDMPLHYGSILNEHEAVRTRAGLFDISHMGRIRVTGPDSEEFLDRLLPLHVKKLALQAVGYSFFCNDEGGVLDDVTVYRAEDYFLVVVNASNRERIVEWLRGHRENARVEIEDATESMGMMALQGPRAEAILQNLVEGNLKSIWYYRFAILPVLGIRSLLSRTGYTGEDGFEVYCGTAYLKSLWEKILSQGEAEGAVPVGLGARDLLRLEASMPLYGHELTLDATPLQAGLDRFVDLEKGDFIGRTALLHSTSTEFYRRLIGFEMRDTSIPRAEATILFEGMPIGRATSGAYSPTLKRGIGMGYIDAVKSKQGTKIEVEIHHKNHPAEIVKMPFYRRPKQR